MKRTMLPAALCLAGVMLTACAKPNIPPADYGNEPLAADAGTLTSAQEATQTDTTVTETEPLTAPPMPTGETEAETDDTDDASFEDASEHPPMPQTESWAEAYARLLRIKNAASAHNDSYYALIRLNPDKIPELVILDDVYMQLYTCRGEAYELLMEDAYKSNAAMEQNVCFQPIVGKFASYFSTMGGGTGYNIYIYEQLDPNHVTRYCFNNNEDEGGEMPYNTLWDSAEDFGISNNGWTDVTLDDRWTHIGEGFDDLHDLTNADPATLQRYWETILEETGETDEE